ncbi:MAG: hypothetical protein AAGC46_10700, partial [Solirubrobacteraceae bacterium]|nr:hypothetical protein [Patulibacter sp.]
DAHPPIGGRIPLGIGGSDRVAPAIRSTIGLAATAPDPAGGAPWAIRTFQRPALAGPAGDRARGSRVWCTQLGRLVDGRFVWIAPGAERVGPIRADMGETTVCATSSPIAQRLGVMVASMPDRPVREAGAEIGATVIWGSVDGPATSARVQHDGSTTALPMARHGVLRVLPGTATATVARLAVTDRGGATRYAIPPGYFVIDGPMMMRLDAQRQAGHRQPAGWLARPRARGASSARVVDPTSVRQFATFPQPNSDVPGGLFAPRAAATRAHCYLQSTGAVAGRPVVPDRHSGLLRQPPLTCNPLPPGSAKRIVEIGGSGSSDDTYAPGTPAASVAYRRRVWQRIPPGSDSVLLAVPPGTAMVEVASPVGVKTVRVGPERITRISWVGQPAMMRALFSMAVRRKDGSYAMRYRGAVVFRALDARGAQVGRALAVGGGAQVRR